MKNPYCWLAAALLPLACDAVPLAQDSFSYTAASTLNAQSGGSGWPAAWYYDGSPAVVGAAGLGFTDSLGNVLNASGLCADTTGAATTRSLRVISSTSLNNVWISFLYQLPATNNKFEGVSFYRGIQATFSINNPSTTATAGIYLTNNLVTPSPVVNTQRGVFGTTHLVVLKLTKGGGAAGVDRVEVYIDPLLSGTPSSPAATLDGSNFDTDRVRIAGESGSKLLVDELRVGDTFADVTPYTPVPSNDIDHDGLTDSQESVLGLDPNVSDAALIAGIQAHPEWFGLYTTAGILNLGQGGVMLQPTVSNEPVDFIFEAQQSEDLDRWDMLATFNRHVELPAGKNFLRITLQDQ